MMDPSRLAGIRFHAIDPKYVEETMTTGAGDIYLRARNIVSCGIKKSDTAFKYLGLRPDDAQDGTEQLEFTITKIVTDEQDKALQFSDKVSDDKYRVSTSIVDIISTPALCRQLFPCEKTVHSFQATFTIHVTGLTVEYKKDIDEYWFYNTHGVFRFRIRRPKLLDWTTLEPLHDDRRRLYLFNRRLKLVERP
jgi:hypothetical protein